MPFFSLGIFPNIHLKLKNKYYELDELLPELVNAQKDINKELADENLAQTVITEGAEIEPVIPEPKVEEVVSVEPVEQEVVKEEKTKKQTRSRRPNRNTQKKPKTTKKSSKKEEKIVNE